MFNRLTTAAVIAAAFFASATPAKAFDPFAFGVIYEAELWAWDLYLEDMWDADAAYAYIDAHNAWMSEGLGYHQLGRWYAMSALNHCNAYSKKPWKPSHLTCGIVQSWLHDYLNRP